MYLYRSSLPRVVAVVPDPTFRHLVEYEDAPECAQVAVMNLRGPLYFGATEHVERTLLALLEGARPRRWLLLRLHGVDQCDYTGIEMLETVVQAFRTAGGDVFVVQIRPPVRAIMESSGFLNLLGTDHVLAQEAAIDHLFEEVIDPAVCWYVCPNRVFAECQAISKHPQGLSIPPHRPRRVEPWRRVAAEQAEALIAERSALIVDLREPDEYEHGHLRDAFAMPLGLLFSKRPELPRDRPLLLVCRSGRRSLRGLRLLLELGYDDVYALKGGILSWKATDRPLEVD
jgi:SulP family sulfate permease